MSRIVITPVLAHALASDVLSLIGPLTTDDDAEVIRFVAAQIRGWRMLGMPDAPCATEADQRVWVKP